MTKVTWEPLPPLPAPSRLRPSSVLVLYRVRLRRRWFQELLAVAGIAAGVALLYAASVANSSLSGPVRQLNQGIVGNSQLQVVARSADGFSESLYDTIRDVPGVRRAAPILQASASILGPRGRRSVTIYGSDPRVVQLRGALLQGFGAADLARQEVLAVTTSTAERLGLHVGDLARVQIAGRNQVAGIVVLGRRDIGALADTTITLAPLAYLQSLAQLKHRVSRVLVEAAPGQTAAVRAQLQHIAAGRLDVRSADYEPRLFDKTSRPTAQATMISSTLSALVGFMFAACAMLVTVASRRALVVDLRRSGFTTRQIGVILLFDALVLGACAVLLGLALGEVLSRRGFSADIGFLEGAFPIGNERVVGWSSVVIAAAGGMLAAAFGVLAPMRGALTTHPPARGRANGQRNLAVLTPRRFGQLSGLALLGASITITIAAPGAALVGLIALTLAVVLLLPSVLDTVLIACRWLCHRAPRTLMACELALPQLHAPTWRVRSLAIATTGALAVLGASALQGARANLQAGLDRAASVEYDHAAAVWVSPYGPGDLFAVTPTPATATQQQLATSAGVRKVLPYRGSFLDVAGNRAWVRAPAADSSRPIPTAQILHGSSQQATPRFRAGGWATLSRSLADALHARVGERFTLPSPVPTTLRLAAITTNLGWPGGAVILNSHDYARAWGSDAVSAYQLKLMPGISPDQGRAAVQTAIGARSPLRVETATQRDQREMAASRGGLSRLRQISSLMLIAAVIAMGAAMAGLLWQQRASVARQKLDGHTTAVMWRSLAIESGVLFGTGCLLGGIASLLGQVLFSRGLQTISGFPVIATTRIEISVVSVAVVTAVALLVVAVPGYLVARVGPSLRTSD